MALLLLGVSLSLSAQMKLTVQQLVSFVKSAVELKQPDKQVAAYLGKVQLSEKLDGTTMEDLQALGIGPRTSEALNALWQASKALPAAPKAAQPPPPPPPLPAPPEEEQHKVLAQARDYAMNYTKTLPDFLCTQVTRRFVDPNGKEFWAQQDVITARVAYVDHHEDYKLVMLNNKMVASDKESMHSVGGATSTGEFGSLMAEVFDPASEAFFGWERWATLRGRRAYVFNYRVSQLRSKWHVTYEKSDDIVPAYHGLVFVDRDSQTVMRITMEAELPASFPIQQAYTVLDYDYATISGQPFILPLKAVVRLRHGQFMSKNEVEFRLYRKFSAEASISFDVDTPEPLPEDKTQEQPPK
jgi:hypothetical protein